MNRLKSLREDRGMTMKECAMRLKMPYTTYVNYEKGAREPNSETLIQIANFFGVSVDFLVGRDTKQSLSCENSSSEIEKKQAEYVALFRKRMDLEAEVERLNKEAERYHKKSRVTLPKMTGRERHLPLVECYQHLLLNPSYILSLSSSNL